MFRNRSARPLIVLLGLLALAAGSRGDAAEHPGDREDIGDLITFDPAAVVDERHVRLTIVEQFSPGLVLHALSAGIGSEAGAGP